ncbi:MAG: hypothetical protein OEN23_05660 [Paracoccaceae bacterium]|nr:hypothetical protein [Paracoccaceae bacterium]
MADAYDFWAERITAGEAAAIVRFWEAFVKAAPAIDGTFSGTSEPVDVAAEMANALGNLNDAVTSWEFGPVEGGHFLALSPELDHVKRPLMRAMVRRAPDIPRFEFCDARRPHTDLDVVPDVVASRMARPFSLSGAKATEGDHRRVDITGCGGSADAAHQAALLFSIIVGEEIERDWLGEIHAERTGGGFVSRLFGSGDPPTEPMSWLPGFEEEAMSTLARLMDARPAARMGDPVPPDSEGALYQSEPHDSDNPRADAITYQTVHTDYAAARFAGARISSVRFSRHGESFLGLRIERTAEQPFNEVADRAEISEALDAQLRAAGAGGVFGEGHGKGHVYIDFATTDIELAIASVERELGRLDVAGPAAILFDEAGLEDKVLPLRIAGTAH